MRRGFAIGVASLVVGVVSEGVIASCDNEPEHLPAIGQVVLEIDTDAPVPAAVNRTRIDIYGMDGTWLDSRDVVRVNTVDWPLSFALTAANAKDARDVIVRVRAYPEGRVRAYTGTAFTPVPTFAPPAISHTVTELCTNTPAMPPDRFTVSIGDRPITGTIAQAQDNTNDAGFNDCSQKYTAGGTTALTLQIPTAGRYRFQVTDVSPNDGNSDPVIFIRQSCSDPLTQVACDDDPTIDSLDKSLLTDNALWPNLDAYLQAGTYTFMVASNFSSATDVTVQWGPSATFRLDAKAGNDGGTSDPASIQPRLKVNGVDQTPATEPVPETAIDRLVRVHIQPDLAAKARVVLRMACTGVDAKMATPIDQSQSCLDTEKTLAPLAVEAVTPNDGVLAKSQLGSAVPVDACADADNTENVACMPAGAFLLGALQSPTSDDTATTPEHLALMNRFWLDKDELSVARYRAILAKGFTPADGTPTVNEGPLTTTYKSGTLCTWSTETLSGADNREKYPLNCVSWATARKLCQYLGGDLPTEAQWEYAATAAGRPFETRWPWGGDDNQDVGCDRAVTGRGDVNDPSINQYGGLYTQCALRGYGPAALDTAVGANGDVTPLGVRNMGGSESEWVLDAFQSYSSPCWEATSLYNPVCWEVEPGGRVFRGASWALPPVPPIRRASYRPNGTYPNDIGVRCAYPAKPTVLP